MSTADRNSHPLTTTMSANDKLRRQQRRANIDALMSRLQTKLRNIDDDHIDWRACSELHQVEKALAEALGATDDEIGLSDEEAEAYGH